MKTLQFNPEYFLVEQEIPKETIPCFIPKPIVIDLVLDCSGSMGYAWDGLIKDVIGHVQNLSEVNYLNVLWFSSKGEYGFIVKGASLRDKETIYKLLRNHKPAFNMTCFSDVLVELGKTIKEQQVLSDRHTLCFFSDGQVNQGQETVIKTLKDIAPYLTMSLLVGYGPYISKPEMAKMAQTLGGALIQASNLSEFSQAFSNFNQHSALATPKTEIQLKTRPVLPFGFTLSHGTVENVDLNTNDVYVDPSANSIYYFTKTAPTTPINYRDFGYEGIYAGARALIQDVKPALALELLGVIGDVAFVNDANNALTVEEYGRLEANLLQAVYNLNHRFIMGQKPGCVPKEDTFCILDLVDVFEQDEEAKFYSNHFEWEYNLTGRKQRIKDGYPKFEANPDSSSPLNGFVWNGKRLNLSIQCYTEGRVNLGPEAKNFGFAEYYPVTKINNYTLIQDGNLNIKKLPVKLSTSSFSKLTKDIYDPSVLDSPYFDFDSIITLDLTKIPIMNRKIGKEFLDTDKLCEKIWRELELEANLKVLNYYFKEFDKKDYKETVLSKEQLEFLESKGVKDGIYSAPKEALPATDQEIVTGIEFAVKGYSTSVKVEDVASKISLKSKLTGPEELHSYMIVKYHAFLDLLEKEGKKENNAKARFSWLEDMIKADKKELKQVRNYLAKAKMSVILGKQVFEGFEKLEKDKDNAVQKMGKTFLIKIRDKVIKF